MEWSISKVDFPASIDPERAEILLGLDTGLGGSYGRTFLIRHDGALKAMHRDGMTGAFRVTALSETSPPRIAPGKWGGEQLVLVTEGGDEKRLDVSHRERELTLEVLEGVYRATERHRELAALLEQRLASTHDLTLKLATAAELASLSAERLESPERAVAFAKTWLELRHDDDHAIALLERLTEVGTLAAFELLETTYRELRRHAPLAELYARRAAHEPTRAVELSLAAAQLFEAEVLDPARALTVVLSVLAEHPGRSDVLARADALAEKSGAWSLAAAGFRAAEQATEDPALDVALLWRIGRAHRRAGEDEAAIIAMQELTWLDPQHREGLVELAALFEARDRHHSRAEVLERLVELAEDDRSRIGWLLALADTLATHLEDSARAVATLEAVLALDDHNDPALAALARLHEGEGRYAELVAVLDRRAERAGVTLRAELFAQGAAISEAQLSDEEGAMRRWRLAHGATPGHEQAMGALERLYTRHRRWLELVNALEQHALAVDDDKAVAALVKAAELCDGELGQPERAIACYERARELAPDAVHVLRALWQGYRRRPNPTPVLEVLGALLALAPERGEELTLRVERAEWQRKAGELEAARSDLERALALASKATDERIRLLLAKGEVELALELPDAAAKSYERVLELDPTHTEAFQQLERLLSAAREHRALATLYERRAGFVATERSSWLRRAAELAAAKLADPALAVRLALEALDADWQDTEAQATLATIGATPAAWQQVFEALESRLGAHPEGERRRFGRAIDRFIEACRANAALDADDVLLRAARHHEKVRRAPKRALALYRRAYRRRLDNRELEARVRALLVRLERHTELVEHLRQVLDADLYEGDDRRDRLGELASTLEAVGQLDEAAELRRRLALPRVVAVASAAAVAVLGVLVYFLWS